MATSGLVTMTPSSIASTGTGNSSSINTNGSVTFSSCATLSLNGVFTSSYDNYMIVGRLLGTISTGARMTCRLTIAGTPQTAGTYTSQYFDADSTTISASRATAIGRFFNQIQTYWSGASVYMFGPYLAQQTVWRTVDSYGRDGGRIIDSGVTYSDSAQCDGISLSTSSGEVSGLITVYGFNQ
jgi:hypothetical protein